MRQFSKFKLTKRPTTLHNNVIVSNESQKKLTNNLQSEQIKNTIDIEQIKKMYKMQQYINDMYDKKVKKQ